MRGYQQPCVKCHHGYGYGGGVQVSAHGSRLRGGGHQLWPTKSTTFAGSPAPGRVPSVSRVIEVRNLGKKYGTTVAVDGLSFTVRPGQVTGFSCFLQGFFSLFSGGACVLPQRSATARLSVRRSPGASGRQNLSLRR